MSTNRYGLFHLSESEQRQLRGLCDGDFSGKERQLVEDYLHFKSSGVTLSECSVAASLFPREEERLAHLERLAGIKKRDAERRASETAGRRELLERIGRECGLGEQDRRKIREELGW